MLDKDGRLIDLRSQPKTGDFHILTRSQASSFLPFEYKAMERVSPIFSSMVREYLAPLSPEDQINRLQWLIGFCIGRWQHQDQPSNWEHDMPMGVKGFFPKPINEDSDVLDGSKFLRDSLHEEFTARQPLQGETQPWRLAVTTPAEYAYLRGILFSLLGERPQYSRNKEFNFQRVEKLASSMKLFLFPHKANKEQIFSNVRLTSYVLAGQQEWTQNNRCLHLHADNTARSFEAYKKHKTGIVLHCDVSNGGVEISSPCGEIRVAPAARELAFVLHGAGSSLTLSLPVSSIPHLKQEYVDALKSDLEMAVDVVGRPDGSEPQSHRRPLRAWQRSMALPQPNTRSGETFPATGSPPHRLCP